MQTLALLLDGSQTKDAKKTIWSYFNFINCFRYDYENCDSTKANQLMSELESLITSADFKGKSLSGGGKTYKVAKGENFSYTDPVDKSVSKNQVIKWYFDKVCHITLQPLAALRIVLLIT